MDAGEWASEIQSAKGDGDLEETLACTGEESESVGAAPIRNHTRLAKTESDIGAGKGAKACTKTIVFGREVRAIQRPPKEV